MKDSEKHYELEKLKKKSAQELSSNALKISIDQWVQIKQSSENNNLKKVSIKEDENWYKAVLQKMKKLNIKKNKNLITCEWSYWITCYNDECKKHHKMNKQNQYYLQEFWKYISQNKKK